MIVSSGEKNWKSNKEKEIEKNNKNCVGNKLKVKLEANIY